MTEHDSTDSGQDLDVTERALRIRDWIVSRLYAANGPELAAIEPLPLFDETQVEDGRAMTDDD